MKLDYLSVPLAVTALIVSALALGSATQQPHQSVTVQAPMDTITAPPCAEDDPCWNCLTMGNRICGDPKGENLALARKAWTAGSGATKLKVDPSRTFTVGYIGYADGAPRLDDGELAIPGTDGLWYVFRAQYSN